MCDLNKRSSKEGVIYGQDVGSGTNILKRKLQRLRPREGREQGTWGKTRDSSLLWGWRGGGVRGRGDEGWFMGSRWEGVSRYPVPSTCLSPLKKEGRKGRSREKRKGRRRG